MESSNKEENSEKSGDEVSCTPPSIQEIAENIKSELLPAKSREKYEGTYITYVKWQASNNIKITSENVLRAYFKQLSERYKPPTLWSTWSKLKSTIGQKEGIDINKFKQLKAFVKRQSNGYKGKKSKVLSSQEVETFLKEAPENKYLATKVALIFGVCGACGREELAKIKVHDVQHQGEILLVKILDTKNKVPRTFTIQDEFCKIVKYYESLRPPNVSSNRYFLNYQNGKCTSQVIGKNKFGAMPKQIAEYLNLPDPSLYTGHSFRRTSATLLANSEAYLIALKLHGGWKSSTVAEGCTEDSVNNKRKIGHMITSSISMAPSTSMASSTSTALSTSTASSTVTEPEAPPMKKIKQVNVIAMTTEIIDNISDSTEARLNIDNGVPRHSTLIASRGEVEHMKVKAEPTSEDEGNDQFNDILTIKDEGIPSSPFQSTDLSDDFSIPYQINEVAGSSLPSPRITVASSSVECATNSRKLVDKELQESKLLSSNVRQNISKPLISSMKNPQQNLKACTVQLLDRTKLVKDLALAVTDHLNSLNYKPSVQEWEDVISRSLR